MSPVDQNLRIEDYRILHANDLSGLTITGPASLEGIYLSPIALIAHLELDLPSPTPGDTAQSLDPLKRQIRTLLRLLLDQIRKHGVDCPAVALLSPRNTSAMSTQDAEDEFQKSYASLASNQEWHRGEFLVFIEKNNDDAKKRLQDLLAPTPPRVELTKAAQTLKEVMSHCEKDAGKSSVLYELTEAWKSALEEGQQENLQGAQLEERASNHGETALRRIASEVLKPVEQLLEEIG